MTNSPEITSARMNALSTIWSIVEARQQLPAVIVVTGATGADDTEAVASGLASVALTTGQRTGYLRLSAGGPDNEASADYATLSISPRASQREAFDTALKTWRTMYDVVIVDAGGTDSEALRVHAARVCDGVVIAACNQRRVVAADHNLARVLREVRASLIGVVSTAPARDPKAIRALSGRSSFVPAVQSK